MRNGFQKFISGKGFYLALAVCLAGAGAAAWVAVDKTIENIETTPLSETPQVQQQADSAPAEQKLDNIAQDDSLSLQKEEPEDSTSAAADGDSAPADQSMKQQINADAGEQDDSSTQVSQPSVQPESSSSAGESAEASALPEQQQSSGDFSLTLPVSGAAITPFSGDMLVKNETLGDWRTHNGVDYACKPGEDVLAPVSGTVESLAAEGNWGVVAAIRDGEGRLWRLSALEDAAVRQGDAVTAGQKLGQAGVITGESAQDPHIHLEVLDGDQYLDPVKLIGS